MTADTKALDAAKRLRQALASARSNSARRGMRLDYAYVATMDLHAVLDDRDRLLAERQSAEERQDGAPRETGAVIVAAKAADWQQVVLNGGPPCFHVEDGRFCLRAERWSGHGFRCGNDHEFRSLVDLLAGRYAAEGAQ